MFLLSRTRARGRVDGERGGDTARGERTRGRRVGVRCGDGERRGLGGADAAASRGVWIDLGGGSRQARATVARSQPGGSV